MRAFAVTGMRLFVAVVLFGLALGIAGGATIVIGLRALPAGANHNNDGAVHVCVNNSTGVMREVSRPNQCRSFEHAVDLDAAGAAGPVSGYEIIVSENTIPNGSFGSAQAVCSSGKRVIGGGGVAQNLNPAKETPLLGSIPNDMPGLSSGWTSWIFNDAGVPIKLSAYAICANVAP